MRRSSHFQSIVIQILTFMIIGAGLALSTAGATEKKRPYCKISQIKKKVEDGGPVFTATLQVFSHKQYWWIKTAGVKDSPSKRTCKEDKSKGYENSRALLNEIFITYPDMKDENGIFDVKIVPSKTFTTINNLTECTYEANLTYRHGTTDFKVKGTFIINPGIAVAPPEAKTRARPAKPAVQKIPAGKHAPEVKKVPDKVAKKTEPKAQTPKIFKAKDLVEPKKVKISEESKVAMAQPIEKKTPSISPATASNNFKQGIKAFTKKDFAGAITHFEKIPVPKTRQRGIPEREDYVKGNYYKGMASQKLGKIKKAISAYQKVLSYEKYFPLVQMNMGICYMELKQYAKAHKAFEKVIRDQNRIPPELYDDVMQRSRYFWAITWTRLFSAESEPDRKAYYRRQATSKWMEYKSWFGDEPKYAKANAQADLYLSSMK